MALINCPECGKEVSDKATQCIHCGYPLNNATNAPTKEKVKQQESEEKYKVLLTEYENRIKTINVIKEVADVSSDEAKYLRTKCPVYIVGNITKAEFEKIKYAFSAVGATVKCEKMRVNEIPIPRSKVAAVASAKLKPCPTCQKSISTTADACPFCGHSFVNKKKEDDLGFWGVVCAIIVAILILIYL